MAGFKRRKQTRAGRTKATKQKRLKVGAEVKKNTKDIKLLKSVGFQYAPFQLKSAATISNAIHSTLLSAPNNWGGIFRMHGVSNADLPRQYHLKSVHIDYVNQCEETDVGNLWVQTMVVSLKRRMAAQVIERTTRLSNFTENLDYTALSAGTNFALQGSLGYKLNPDLYTVHYNSGQKRIGEATMGESVRVTNINNGTDRGSTTIKFPRVFKNDETSSSGFKEINYEKLEPRQQLYLLVFSNTGTGTGGGGQLFHSYRAIFNGHCNNPN
jgi:hypothetical protein